MKLIAIAAALGAVLTLPACATVTRGTNTDFNVRTDPAGAAVKTTNGYTCAATPCAMRMPRKSSFQATITKPGYKTVTATIGNRVSGGGGAGLAGNILIGGIIGAGVDAGTGAALDLRPDPLVVKLEPGEGEVTLTQQEAEAHSSSHQDTIPDTSKKRKR